MDLTKLLEARKSLSTAAVFFKLASEEIGISAEELLTDVASADFYGHGISDAYDGMPAPLGFDSFDYLIADYFGIDIEKAEEMLAALHKMQS